MHYKLILTLTVFLAFLSRESLAAETYHCTRENSTRSFLIDLDGYHDGKDRYAAVKTIQYPNETTQLYKIEKRSRTQEGDKIHMSNTGLRAQADQNLILHNEKRLEVFWIVGCTGFCTGGNSGSIFYECERN